MGDILVPYFNKQLPFLGFEDYSINGGGPPTDADQCLIVLEKVPSEGS